MFHRGAGVFAFTNLPVSSLAAKSGTGAVAGSGMVSVQALSDGEGRRLLLGKLVM